MQHVSKFKIICYFDYKNARLPQLLTKYVGHY